MKKFKGEPSEKKPEAPEPSRIEDLARRVAEEYANDQREIIKKLRKTLN